MTGTNKVEVSTTGFSPIADPFRNSLKKRFSLPSHHLRWCTSFIHVFKTKEMVWSLPCKRSTSLLWCIMVSNWRLFTSLTTDLKKILDRASIVWKMKPKNCSGGHLTRTQSAADPSEESMRNNPPWIVRWKFKDFRTTWRYAFNIRFNFFFISPINNKLGPTNMAPMASKTWVLKQ